MRSNPFSDIEELIERMSTELPVGGGGPRVDLIDQGDSFLLRVDVPGYNREDLDLSLRDRQLTVTATRDEDHLTEDVEGTYLRRERDRRMTSRTIRLPDAVEADSASATYEDGVLEITLQKREPEEGHTISVE